MQAIAKALGALAQGKRGLVARVLGARVLHAAASTVIVPFLVPHFSSHLGLPLIDAVLLASLVLVGGRLFSGIIGRFLDRHSARRTACGGALLSAVALAMMAMPLGLIVAIVVCAALTLASAVFTLATRAFFAREFSGPEHAPLVAASSVAYNLGLFIGATTGAGLLTLGGSPALIPASIGLMVAAALLLAFGPADRSPDSECKSIREAQSTQSALSPALLAVTCTTLCTGFLATSVMLVLALYCERVFGQVALAAAFFSSQGLALLLLLPATVWLSRNASTGRLGLLYAAGQVTTALGALALGMSSSVPLVGIVALAIGFGIGQVLSVPSLDPLLTRLAPAGRVGQALGRNASAGALGSVAACLSWAAAMKLVSSEGWWLLWVTAGGVGLLVALRTAAVLRRSEMAGAFTSLAGGAS